MEPVFNHRLQLSPALINYSQAVPVLVKIKAIWLSSTLFRLNDIWNTRSHIWWELRSHSEQRSWGCSDCLSNTSEPLWIVTPISDHTGRAANSNTAIHHRNKCNCWPHFWFPTLTKQLSSVVNLSSLVLFEKVQRLNVTTHLGQARGMRANCWAPSNEVCTLCERCSRTLMTALFHYIQIQPWQGDQSLHNKKYNAVLCNMHIPSEYTQCFATAAMKRNWTELSICRKHIHL